MTTKPEDIISCYTRQQAIEDGIFVDVSQVAKEWGFKIPVAITTNLFTTHIKKETEVETDKCLSAFLGILRMKINESKEKSNMLYTQFNFNAKDHTDVWAVVEAQSPTDPSPAMNIMLPSDY